MRRLLLLAATTSVYPACQLCRPICRPDYCNRICLQTRQPSWKMQQRFQPQVVIISGAKSPGRGLSVHCALIDVNAAVSYAGPSDSTAL